MLFARKKNIPSPPAPGKDHSPSSPPREDGHSEPPPAPGKNHSTSPPAPGKDHSPSSPPREDGHSEPPPAPGKDHGKALFIQQMIHDIQGDFLGVTGICQSMRKGLEEKKDISGLLNILLENCRTYKDKMGNFLEFTRMQAGLCRTVREPVNIRQLLNKVIDEYEYLWIDKNARIGLDISGQLPAMISCDEGRITTMVANLFVNAVNWSPPGSSVSIEAGRKEQRWTLTVTDNGGGMTEEQLEAVFATAPAKRVVLRNTAGLGLIVTRWLAEEVLGGRLSLDSRPGMGTTAILELPFYPYE